MAWPKGRPRSAESIAKSIKWPTKYIPVTETGCWLWVGGWTTDGYGVISRGGKRSGAHRVFYELHKGPIHDGLLVCHKCDTPCCVNPDHMFLGAQTDNMRDCRNKNRLGTLRGSASYGAKVTESDVVQIRIDRKTMRAVDIAKRYGIHPQTVRSIVLREKWKHVP